MSFFEACTRHAGSRASSMARASHTARGSGKLLKLNAVRALEPSKFDTYALANVRPKYTGLPMVVYISEKTARHGPRIRVSQSYGDDVRGIQPFSMTIEPNPRIFGKRGDIRARDIGLIMEFIELNLPLLLAYWEQEPVVDTVDMIQSLRKIDP